MKKIIILVSIALFLASLFNLAVEFERVCRTTEVAGLWEEPIGKLEQKSGINLFVSGGFGLLFFRFGALGWLANPIFIFSSYALLTRKKVKNIKWLSAACLILALISLPITNFLPLPADEGVVCWHSAIAPLLGYWLWLGAMIFLNVSVWLEQRT